MIITRTATGAEPVSLVDMKAYLRVFHDSEDGVITALIKSARKTLEDATGLSLVATDITLKAVIHGEFRLPYGPVDTVTKLEVDGEDVSGDLELDVIDKTGVLEAQYSAGPYDCETAVKELVAFTYANRGEGTIPQSVNRWIMNNTMNLWLQ